MMLEKQEFGLPFLIADSQAGAIAHSAQRQQHTACKPTCNTSDMQLQETSCRRYYFRLSKLVWLNNMGTGGIALAAGWDAAKEHYCLRPQKLLCDIHADLD